MSVIGLRPSKIILLSNKCLPYLEITSSRMDWPAFCQHSAFIYWHAQNISQIPINSTQWDSSPYGLELFEDDRFSQTSTVSEGIRSQGVETPFMLQFDGCVSSRASRRSGLAVESSDPLITIIKANCGCTGQKSFLDRALRIGWWCCNNILCYPLLLRICPTDRQREALRL